MNKKKIVDKSGHEETEFEPLKTGPGLSRKQAGQKRSALKKIMIEFSDASTIHGMKYIGTRPLHEKVWWLLIFCISICICVFQIWTIYKKWKANPVIISIDQKFTPIGEIPFPAVTICGRFALENETQFEYGVVLEELLENGMETIESEFVDLFELTSEMCYDKMGSSLKKNISNLFKNRKNRTFNDLIDRVFLANISDFVTKCQGIESPGSWPCLRGFIKILTRNGLCLSFNMLRREELVKDNVTLFYEDSSNSTTGWNPENGYESKSPVMHKDEKDDFPHRTFTIGRKFQARVKRYRPKWGMNVQCLNQIRVYIHHPKDFPWELETSLLYEYGDSINSIVVTPEVMVSSLELQQSCSADQRNCFFDNERQLKFFKIYSKSNCEVECLTNITYKECGCVLYWMPRFIDTPICGIKQHKCYSLHAYRYLNLNIASASTDIINQYDIPFKCNCLPRCNSVTYLAEKKGSESQYNMIDEEDDEEEEEDNMPIFLGSGFKARSSIKQSVLIDETKISTEKPPPAPKFVDKADFEYLKFKVEFQKAQILPYKRVAPYQTSDFIANCGGLLGLFMGISLLSVVEIIYFFTFRFIGAVQTVKANMAENEIDEK